MNSNEASVHVSGVFLEGLIFYFGWENNCHGSQIYGYPQIHQHSNVIFKMQKSIIRVMVGIINTDSCREYFQRMKILPLQSQYLLSLLLFVADNGDYFKLNSEIHSFNTKNKSNLHPPPSKLTVFQRGPSYSGIKAFNNLPSYVKNLLQTKKQFKRALEEFLYSLSFYTLNEFYNYNKS
jgi:hypothetical protein